MITNTAIAALTLSAGFAFGSVVQIDFGDLNNQTGGNVNNITHLQNPLFNLVDTTGVGSGIGLDVTDVFWPGSNTGGTGAPTGAASGIAPSATADNLFGSVSPFGGFTEPTGGFVLSGLDASGQTLYDFSFFASRMNVSDSRWTKYDATGANSGTASLNTSNNTDTLVTIAGISADANGEIFIGVGADSRNDNSFGFYYLGYLEIETRPVPAPGAFAVLASGGLLCARRRR